MNPLLEAHRHTSKNREELEGSKLCGCCCCIGIFKTTEIVAWTGLDIDQLDNPETAGGETALCPRCGSEALIGDRAGYALTPDFLNKMNQAWYQTTRRIKLPDRQA
ncbi:hypothetical protein [Aquabacterium humicola]|uniref:hypothetical protein n=1 Tax=Aquabacterium humicola TaxID=3237377 RepID=UPI00254369EF|nr:hypothetical protein [Rubrivivax pictus]